MRIARTRSLALLGLALPALLAICTFAAACAAGPGPAGSLGKGAGSSSLSNSPSVAEDRFTVLEDARQLLDFEGPRVGGGRLRGFDYLNRDVVLWVFAPW